MPPEQIVNPRPEGRQETGIVRFFGLDCSGEPAYIGVNLHRLTPHKTKVVLQEAIAGALGYTGMAPSAIAKHLGVSTRTAQDRSNSGRELAVQSADDPLDAERQTHASFVRLRHAAEAPLLRAQQNRVSPRALRELEQRMRDLGRLADDPDLIRAADDIEQRLRPSTAASDWTRDPWRDAAWWQRERQRQTARLEYLRDAAQQPPDYLTPFQARVIDPMMRRNGSARRGTRAWSLR